MQRRSIDTLFSIGFFAAAALLVVVGFVMADNAQFLDSSVTTQIRQLNVAFPAKDALTEPEAAVPCISANASKLVESPGQARCYANNFLGARIDGLMAANPTTQAQRDALLRGNTLRSLLMTNYTIDGFATHTRQIADVAYVAAAIFALLGLAALTYAPAAEAESKHHRPHLPAKLRRHAQAA